MKKIIIMTLLIATLFVAGFLLNMDTNPFSNREGTTMSNFNDDDTSDNEVTVTENSTFTEEEAEIPIKVQPEMDELKDKPFESEINDSENLFNENIKIIKTKLNLVETSDSEVSTMENAISTENEAVMISIVQPEIHGLKDKQFENEINKKIADYYDAEIKKIKSSAAEYLADMKRNNYSANQFELKMNYEMIVSGDLVNILITTRTYTGAATDMVRVMSVNIINELVGKQVCISDIIDVNTLNQLIIQYMNNDKENYYSKYTSGELTFQIIREDQAFYVSNHTIYVLFNKYEIAPGAGEIQTIAIPIYRD